MEDVYMDNNNDFSIRGLSIAEPSKSKKSINTRNVNYNAGADILHHFQLQWNELHELAEENAGKAQEADVLISTIYEKLQQEWNHVTCLNNTLAYIPKINNAIQDLMDQIGNKQLTQICNDKLLIGMCQMKNLPNNRIPDIIRQ